MKNPSSFLTSWFVVAGLCLWPLPLPQQSAGVAWETQIPAQWFPANVLTYGGDPAPATGQVLCDGRSSFHVRIRSSQPRTRVHVEVNVDGFFVGASSCDVILEKAGQTYVVAPTPRWDMHKLAYNDQPVPATVSVSVKANGINLGQRTQRVELRSINDIPIVIEDEGGHSRVNYDGFGGFVNENSPVIDQLLHEALNWGAVDNFVGYQRGLEAVHMQVFAIWNALQHRGVKYSDISRASAFSGKGRSQSVRFVDQTVKSSQANCVDGSVLFASVLYKIGIYPVLVLLPGHMFVGYYLDEDSVGNNYRVAPVRNLEFLETTMVGLGGPALNRRFDSSYPPRTSNSYAEFEKAVKVANQEFNQKVRDRWQAREPFYMMTSIRNLRARGVNPIPR